MSAGKIAFAGLLLASFLAGCRQGSPPPGSVLPPTIVLRVSVLRDIGDESRPQPQNKLGYIWSDNHIRTMVLDMINRSEFMAGQPLSFSWPGNVVNEIPFDFTTGNPKFSHVWVLYPTWVSVLTGYNQPNAINIYFVPGIIDFLGNNDFMDSYVLDPAHNREPSWQGTNWAPMMIISDCWVHGSVTEFVEHRFEGLQAGIVPEQYQIDHLVMHHALGRYLFRRTGDTLWDMQENWIAGNPALSPNYMRPWTVRVNESDHSTSGVWQGEIWDRVSSGNWNNP